MRTRSTIFGYALLTVLLTAGAAQGLSGSNTVFSDDIVDGTISTPDLKTGAVSGSKILNNSVTGNDINEASIPGFKKVLVARIKSTGVLVDGDAVSATPDSPGEYTVTFAQSVASCVALAGGALFPGADALTNDIRATTEVTGSQVGVSLRTGSGSPATGSAFVVAVFCK